MPGSSPVVEPEVDPVDTVAQQDVSSAPSDQASSSTAVSETGEKDLLTSVEEALAGPKKEESPASEPDPAVKAESPSEKTAVKPAVADDGPLGELTEDEIGKYGPKTQRRMRQLLRERGEMKVEADKLRPRAEQFDKIEQFITQNRLSNEDVANALSIAAQAMNDPFKAWESLKPIVRQLAELTGNILPGDLETQVRQGFITEAHARELATSRARVGFNDQSSRTRTEEQKRNDEVKGQRDHAEACRSTANEWEKAKKSSDPDWNEKQTRIGELLELSIRREGYPKTKEDVVKLLDGFLTKVDGEFARFKPKPKAINPVTGAASTRATAEPKTALEAAERAIAGSR